MPGIVSIRVLLFYIVFSFLFDAHAQLPVSAADNSLSEGLIVLDIVVNGNRHTKQSIILRGGTFQ